MFKLSEALEAIKNKPEFGVYQRESFTVIDYNVTMRDSFVGDNPRQTLILKNLRGTCFDKNGKIISLSFDKFHNLGECDGWMPNQIDFSKPHNLLEKLDGSMVRAIPISYGYRLGTRAGVTEVAVKAEKFLETQSLCVQNFYNRFILDCIALDWTPIFEYCARDQRIVIDYAEPKLVLTAIRKNFSGKYVPYGELIKISTMCSIPVVQPISTEKSSITEVVAEVKQWIGTEGMVVTFDDGFRVKVKAEDYCLKHRALDGLRHNKDVTKIVLSGALDDVLSLAQPDVKERLLSYNESVWKNISEHTKKLNSVFEEIRNVSSKKEFAELAKESPYRAALFKLYDKKPFNFAEYASTKCGSSTDVESIEWLIGPLFDKF